MAVLSTMIGALTLSRVANDVGLTQHILDAVGRQILTDDANGPGAAGQ